MPIPIQAKKFAAVKAKAAAIKASSTTVGPSKEELEKKYAAHNAKVISKEKEELEKEVNNEEEQNNEEVEKEVNLEKENTEEEANQEEQKQEQDEEETTVEEEQNNEEVEKDNEEIAKERVKERGQINDTDIKIATVPDRTREVPVKEEKSLVFTPKFIDYNPNNPMKDIKDSFNFDLSSIEIDASDNDLKVSMAEDLVLSEDSVYQVILLKSGYVAHMSAITFRDRDAIRGSLSGRTSNKDIPNFRRKLYQIVYSKIKWTNIGKLTFDEFLHITAYDDLETLFFGIFCKSNPKDSSFTIKCPHCKHENKVEVNPQTLASISDPDAFHYIDTILRGEKAIKPLDLIKDSMLSSTQRILLPNSKIVAEIKVPSLNDYLNFSINYANTNLRGDDLTETIGFLIYLKRLLVPNMEKIRATGKPYYYEVSDFFKMLSLVSRFNIADGQTLVDAINDREAKFKIGYEIRSFKCGSCGKEVGASSVSMEDFLF